MCRPGQHTSVLLHAVFRTLNAPATCSHCLQAKKLDDMLAKRGQAIDKVLNFQVPDSLLVRTMAVQSDSPTCVLKTSVTVVCISQCSTTNF